jgi:hypothetical protein
MYVSSIGTEWAIGFTNKKDPDKERGDKKMTMHSIQSVGHPVRGTTKHPFPQAVQIGKRGLIQWYTNPHT